jgi:hypothetical protein
MDFGSLSMQKRREQRRRMVLPLRVSARDASDAQFEELAHTLDVTRMAPVWERFATR